MGNSNGSDEA